MIDNLSVLAPDTARAGRTIARCHDRLERRRLRARTYVIERTVVAGVSIIYLIAMAGDLAALYW
jgi:hypothetical protein